MEEKFEIIEMGSKKLIEVNNSLVVKKIDPDKVFVVGGLNPLIGAIKEKAKSMVAGLDPSKPKDRKIFGSVCGDISSSKVFIEKKMKEHVEELKEKIKPTDKERIRWCAEMDEARDEIDKPRQDWQYAEESKVKAANAVMKELNGAAIVYADTTAADIAQRIERIEQIDVDALPDSHKDNAAIFKDNALAKLYQQHVEVQKREAEAVELAKLRTEAAARAEAEAERNAKEESERIEKERLAREEKLKAEAAAKATREAEEKAAEEKRNAELAIAQAKHEAEKAEQRRVAEAEKARIAQEEAIAKAKRDAEAAEKRRVADAEAARIAQENAVKEAERRAKEESERKEAERLLGIEKQRFADEKRAANKKNREKADREIVAAFAELGVGEHTARKFIASVNAGVFPRVEYRKLCEYIAARDGHCLLCGNPNSGTPAHVISRAQSGDDSKRNVIQLCVVRQDGSKGCHARYDSSEIELPEWIIEMLSSEEDIWK